MTLRTEIKVSADDYRTLPETGPRYQLVHGDLIRMSPAPSPLHQALVGKLFMKLCQHATEHQLGRVFVAPVDVFLSDFDVLQPDVLFLSRGSEDKVARDGIHGAPDLVVEVLSVSTRKLDLGVKKTLYARYGVVEAWYVDPDIEQVHVYDLEKDVEKPAAILARQDQLESTLLPGLTISLEKLFRVV
ncbi:Uma2 family endonuclease [Planctomycetota bacterium]